MIYLIKKFLIILIFILTSFCSMKKVDNIHGVTNLENKSNSLEIGVANKNDIIINLGSAPLKEFKNSDTWLYFEIRDTRNFLGTKKITTNKTLILEFDNKGILVKKKLLNKDQMKNISFAENETISKGLEDSNFKNILSSTRKRLQNAAKRNK